MSSMFSYAYVFFLSVRFWCTGGLSDIIWSVCHQLWWWEGQQMLSGVQVHGSWTDVIPDDYCLSIVYLSKSCDQTTGSSPFVSNLLWHRVLLFWLVELSFFLFITSIFIPPLSPNPFRHLICVPNCFCSLPFLTHLLSLPPSLPPSATFHLFLYLSQWELMWPLCAVSSLHGRQSSSAPIRTALSGTVSTAGMQTLSSIQARRPPVEMEKWISERKKVGRKKLSDTDGMPFPSITRSLTPSISRHRSSLIVFTSRYLCFGPQGADIVSIPTSQTKRETPFHIFSITPHLASLLNSVITMFLVLLEGVYYLFSSLPLLHVCVYLLWEFTISPSPLVFLLHYLSSLWWPLFP